MKIDFNKLIAAWCEFAAARIIFAVWITRGIDNRIRFTIPIRKWAKIWNRILILSLVSDSWIWLICRIIFFWNTRFRIQIGRIVVIRALTVYATTHICFTRALIITHLFVVLYIILFFFSLFFLYTKYIKQINLNYKNE